MLIILKMAIFATVTILLAWYSRVSLSNWRLHGFYRFFAWELIIVLILLNIDFWFAEPFSVYHIISWLLLLFSLIFLYFGFIALYFKGEPKNSRSDAGLLGIEKTSKLVTTGVYACIRHPLYASLFWLAWGTFFKSIDYCGFFLALGASILLVITAKIEEKENILYFGDIYNDYMRKTKMFIPYLF